MADEPTERAALRLVARAAQAQPSTLNDETREVEFIFSTGARAMNYIPGEGMCWEELDMSPGAVRMGRLTAGDAPVLDSHRNYGGVGAVLGRVVSARLEGGKGIARLRFSEADDVKSAWQKIKDGTLRTVSVGYQIHRYEITKAESGPSTVRVTDWEPLEISVVPIPADAGATVRAETMAEPAPADIPPAAVPANQETVAMADQPNAAPAPAAVDIEAIRADAQRAERERITGVEGVLSAARGIIPADVEASLRTRAVSEGLAVEAARAVVFDAMVQAQRQTTTSPAQTVRMGVSGDDPAAIRSAMSDALARRIKPDFKACERASEWAGVGLRDMAGDMLRAQGERNIPRNAVQLAERSFHSTSDFPLLLGDALNKVLLADYQQATPTYRQFMGRRSFSDFKAHKFLRIGDFPALQVLAEGGEIKAGTISENREQVTIATYGRGVRVTRQMLVNDDLGAFGDFAAMIGRRVMDFENAAAFTIVTTASGAGPNLADGSAVFTTGRTNKAASGGVIDVTSLSTARSALRSQTSADGLKLNLSPRYLLTGPAYETIAWQYASAQYTPATAATANPFRGVYEPIVDANITGNNWYLFADPAVRACFEWGLLEGYDAPRFRIEEVFGRQGTSLSLEHDFGCGAIDFRGGYRNAGA